MPRLADMRKDELIELAAKAKEESSSLRKVVRSKDAEIDSLIAQIEKLKALVDFPKGLESLPKIKYSNVINHVLDMYGMPHWKNDRSCVPSNYPRGPAREVIMIISYILRVHYKMTYEDISRITKRHRADYIKSLIDEVSFTIEKNLAYGYVEKVRDAIRYMISYKDEDR